MSADSPPPIDGRSETPAVPAPSVRPAGDSSGFAAVARKVTSRTTDLIAIAVVLSASLVFGRQVIVWWRSEPPDAMALSEPAHAARSWGEGGLPVYLEFGDAHMALTRQRVSGDRDEAHRALVRLCRDALEQTVAPSRPADAAETRFLEKLTGLEPAAAEPGVWQIFEIRQAMPLAAAVRWTEHAAQNGAKPESSPERRLICFGLALPAGEAAWTLYGFQPSGTTARMTRPEPVPLPEGARQIMSVRDERGGSLTAFHGSADVEEWKRSFSAWGAAQGIESPDHWVESPPAHTARFELQRGARREIVEVHITVEGRDRLTGLLNVVPSE
jgi:hypothetical protein